MKLIGVKSFSAPVAIISHLLRRRMISPRNFHCSSFLRAVVVEVVPALGESITEGSIANWTKAVGDKVAVDDVVVVVETDKVTVDIKSQNSGTLTEQLAAPSDTILVGTPLFKIDTSGEAVAPATTSTTVPSQASEDIITTSSVDESKTPQRRIPLIKFIGKRSLLRSSVPAHETGQSSTSTVSAAIKSSKPQKPKTGVDFWSLKDGAWYGRPKLSIEEIDAIESGGASLMTVTKKKK
mmetsp:Transcript_5237/g.5366  ORF Transcript_5237/g.5366 Transcript_5237/m.5366 type:complete len:238 (+) Transcript_5237:199-912(+)|eukprot:CAMPEP_0182428198 /NCGR_PEP_ID=MMETSP1167-20130531/21416_1 /TAXON_ID=2988 /ORGANISM="Mallomonas Sp, Strain CCMP3275" /LENGTH=237 /DNA_ID=CAMNT_0024610943 /DNA_START=199 /DNA_END=912 /DNA_ORIENTATION=+